MLPFTCHSHLKRSIDVSVHVCMNYTVLEEEEGYMRISSQHNATRISKHPMGAIPFRIMGSTINQWPEIPKAKLLLLVPIMEEEDMAFFYAMVKASKAFRGRCCFPVKLASGEREILNRAECHLDRPLLPVRALAFSLNIMAASVSLRTTCFLPS